MHTLSKPLGKYLMLLCVLYTHCTQDNLFGNTIEQGIFCSKIFVESRSVVLLNFCKLSGVASKHSCRHCTHQADYAKVRECRDNPHFSLKSLFVLASFHLPQVVHYRHTCWQEGQQLAGPKKTVGPLDL